MRWFSSAESLTEFTAFTENRVLASSRVKLNKGQYVRLLLEKGTTARNEHLLLFHVAT